MNAIKFGSGTNTLTVQGTNDISTGSDYAAINIGSGLNVIGNGTITVSSVNGAGIGTNASETSTANINIGGNVTVTANANTGAKIGSGSGGSCGTIALGNGITLSPNLRFFLMSLGIRVASLTTNTNLLTLTEPDEPTNTITTTTTETVEVPVTFLKNVMFHVGDKSGQALSVTIGDMHTKSLKANVPSEADQERLINLKNDADKYKAFQELLDQVQDMTLDDINLRTRESANIAIRVIDSALEYATDQAMNIGAYLQRLEQTFENVTTIAENTQAAESVIRDSDMAREMTEYTRANILSQAAQAVLAQVNQNSSNVISLLK